MAGESSTINVLVAPPRLMGALIKAVATLDVVVILPASVNVPVPIILDPDNETEPTEVTLFVPRLKFPPETVNAFVIARFPTNDTFDGPVLLIVRLDTDAGNPLPTDWAAFPT